MNHSETEIFTSISTLEHSRPLNVNSTAAKLAKADQILTQKGLTQRVDI